MNLKPTAGQLLAAALLALSGWIVHGFVDAMLAAVVIVIATWPAYSAFRLRVKRRLSRTTAAALFTVGVTTFLLAPMVFACGALLAQARLMLQGLGAEGRTLALPGWLPSTVGAWFGRPGTASISGPGAWAGITRHADAGAVLGWAQSLGRFSFHQALTVAFTVLLLAFLYRSGRALARDARRWLRRAVGEQANRYVEVGTRAVRASVHSMLAVGLFDALATGLAYAACGAPRAWIWAGITGALAAVPFLGYAAVVALALQLSLQGLGTSAGVTLAVGAGVLICGDKLVRPLAVRGRVRLPFAWVLMGCIGGFGALGLAGLVLGPAVLTLAQELLHPSKLAPVASPPREPQRTAAEH